MSDTKIPNSISAEKILLCSCLTNGSDVVEDVVGIVSEDDFYYENNKTIFHAVRKVHASGNPVDELSVTEHLRSNNQLDEVGGASYVISLTDTVGTSLQARTSAIIIKEHSNKRHLIKTSRLAIEAIEEGKDCTDALSVIEKGIDGLDNTFKEETRLGSNVDYFLEKLKSMKDGSYKPDKFSTGISHLDAKLAEGGIGRGEVMVISAPTSCGKSQLALNVGLKTAIVDRKPVAIFSLEMLSDQIMKRMTQISSGKNIYEALESEDKDGNFDEIMDATKKLCDAPIHMIHSVRDITHLKSRCSTLKRKHGIEMVIIDYLQLIPFNTKLSKCDGIAEISHGIKQMAMALNIPVLLLAQINREGAKSNEPTIYSLKDSGDIENDADIILMMYPKKSDFATSKKLDKNGRPYVELKYKLVKNREGERDTEGIMILDPNVGRFL